MTIIGRQVRDPPTPGPSDLYKASFGPPSLTKVGPLILPLAAVVRMNTADPRPGGSRPGKGLWGILPLSGPQPLHPHGKNLEVNLDTRGAQARKSSCAVTQAPPTQPVPTINHLDTLSSNYRAKWGLFIFLLASSGQDRPRRRLPHRPSQLRLQCGRKGGLFQGRGAPETGGGYS